MIYNLWIKKPYKIVTQSHITSSKKKVSNVFSDATKASKTSGKEKRLSARDLKTKLRITPTDTETILGTHNYIVPTMEHFNSAELGHF